MEAQYKRLYEITERENRRLTKIVEVQKDMIEGLTKEKEMLKAAYNALNKELEEVDPHGDWLGDSVAKLKGYHKCGLSIGKH